MMAVRWLIALAALLVLDGVQVVAAAREAPLIQRSALFGNPVRAQARLSPDGRYVSYLAPKDGVLNIWLAPYGKLGDAKPITNDRRRGIRQHYWAEDARHVLYLQDVDGDENWHVHSVDVESGHQLDLTPLPKIHAEIVGLSYQRPEVALIGINDRNPEWHDVYEVDVTTGTRKMVERNDGRFAAYLADLQLRPRLGVKTLPDGGGALFKRAAQGWESILEYGQEDSLTLRPLVIEEGGNTALLLSASGRDKAALVRIDLASGKQTVVGQSGAADVSEVWLDPHTRTPQAYGAEYLTEELSPLTPGAAKDIDHLKATLGSQFKVVSRTNDDSKWVVVVDEPARVTASYLYDRGNGKINKLFDHRPDLVGVPLRPMKPVEIPIRDNLTMVGYLTLPPGSVSGKGDNGANWRPTAPLPMVLDVHGGPWARDSYGFNPEHQWLANRGYAVLSVNYRGSTGFGKKFINAGDREWAGKMQNDLLDAVDWAVGERVAIPDKVAIYGGSYGGYAALVGLTSTPDRFACGVDIVGPSNLNTLMSSIPAYWKAFFEDMSRRVGDPRTEDGRKLLAERSPLSRVDRIARPLLIAQGANDPRVKQAESDQVVEAMKKKQIPVTYVLYPDEGHGFARPQNRQAFYAIGEGFLSKCLGGRYEAIGSDFDGSSLEVRAGAGIVPGLTEALAKLEAAPGVRPNPNGPGVGQTR